jgi:hypothetical protein
MALDLSTFKTDESKETEGVWEKLDEGCEVKVARWGNTRMVEFYQRYPRVIRQRIDSGQVSDARSAEILAEVIANTILLDWKGMADEGKPVKYSVEAAVKVLSTYKDFRIVIIEIAQDFKLFHDISVGETAKNSRSG